MIFIKIYLDKDENGEDMLVFDSAKEDKSYYFQVAGVKKRSRNREWFIHETEAKGVNLVAISPEAKTLFLEMIHDEDACTLALPIQDFRFTHYHQGERCLDTGSFSFVPLNIKQGDTSRRLRRGEHFKVNYKVSEEYFDFMIPCENEMLKSLDITNPVDEDPLLDIYYKTMRAKGLELGCDVDTIRKTPTKYLTQAQREVIKAEYHRLASGYSSQEWHESRDYDHAAMLEDVISTAVMEKYWKVITDS